MILNTNNDNYDDLTLNLLDNWPWVMQNDLECYIASYKWPWTLQISFLWPWTLRSQTGRHLVFLTSQREYFLKVYKKGQKINTLLDFIRLKLQLLRRE